MSLNRRAFIASASTVLAYPTLARPIRSLLAGSAKIEYEDTDPTAKGYIQSNLIMHYDGIENGGNGIHDNTAQKWVNLVEGSPSATFNATPSWEDDCLITSSTVWTKTISLPYNLPANSEFTVETMFQKYKSGTSWTAVSFGYQNYGGGGRGCFYAPMQRRICVCGNLTQFPDVVAEGVHYITASYNGEIFTRWLDGTYLDEGSPYTINSGEIKNLMIGDLYAAGGYNGDGRVFYVRVYDRALSVNEIEHNRGLDLLRFGLS